MATKRRTRVVTAGQAKQAEDVLRYLYNKGEVLMKDEFYYQGGQLQNGADVLSRVLVEEGINCVCKVGDYRQGIRRWDCSCLARRPVSRKKKRYREAPGL